MLLIKILNKRGTQGATGNTAVLNDMPQWDQQHIVKRDQNCPLTLFNNKLQFHVELYEMVH
jgi:hypothetical protein